MTSTTILLLLGMVHTILELPPMVMGHARLMEPPSRASMWRVGFDNPADFNDNQGYCGGLSHMQSQGGKCGICGDPWDSSPREHEVGGKFANGIITRVFKPGQDINVEVDVTANHYGYFVFKLCPNNNTAFDPDQECFDKLTLPVVPGLEKKYILKSAETGTFALKVRLPRDVWCKQCILQWTWTGANNWGTCTDGGGRLGCGPQEIFRACSDIAVTGDPVDHNDDNEISNGGGNDDKAKDRPSQKAQQVWPPPPQHPIPSTNPLHHSQSSSSSNSVHFPGEPPKSSKKVTTKVTKSFVRNVQASSSSSATTTTSSSFSSLTSSSPTSLSSPSSSATSSFPISSSSTTTFNKASTIPNTIFGAEFVQVQQQQGTVNSQPFRALTQPAPAAVATSVSSAFPAPTAPNPALPAPENPKGIRVVSTRKKPTRTYEKQSKTEELQKFTAKKQ